MRRRRRPSPSQILETPSERIFYDRLQREFLQGIGAQEPQPFVPSPFQEEAAREALERDVLVVAPTGSGKTWIAEQAIRHFKQQGLRCCYTTPLKALSNQKYLAFSRLFGETQVGLLTGERRENPHAPVIVATTEVLRNMIYGGDHSFVFVVLDEVHYIANEDRGTTWEEIILLSRPETRMLLLSATVSNAQEFAGWMAAVRGAPPALIRADERPVPLRAGLFDRFGRALPLLYDRYGKSFMRSFSRERIHMTRLLRHLAGGNLLPAIIFLPRRRDCDEATRRFTRVEAKFHEARARLYAEMEALYPYLAQHHLKWNLVDAGVAPHHAGHMTAWKITVERMLQEGIIHAVFATTTLAAGLDVPARTVVLPDLWTFSDRAAHPLSTLEFHQMCGRAGRRGKDKVGFVMVVPQHPKDFQLARLMVKAEPEPLKSAFRVHDYQVLNLLSRYSEGGALEILQRSFSVYQQAVGDKQRARQVKRSLKQAFNRRLGLLTALGYLRDDHTLSDMGGWAATIRHERCLLVAESIRQGYWDRLSVAEVCGLAGALTSHRSPRERAARVNLRPLRQVHEELKRLEASFRIPSDEDDPYLWTDAAKRAAALKLWAEEVEWETLVARTQSEDGDLQQLILQAAELLQQLADLPTELGAKAEEGRVLILRPPVL